MTIPGRYFLKETLATTAASSQIWYDSDADGDFNDETPTGFTRTAAAPQYVHIGLKDGYGMIDADDSLDYEVDYTTVNTP